jgi:hypothetical protein
MPSAVSHQLSAVSPNAAGSAFVSDLPLNQQSAISN